ncbi:transporter [Alphaproteobacteria bacterium 46_93_T64]|nr:transporter [Alphaproteobacteria bacterium 46_93_T64]
MKYVNLKSLVASAVMALSLSSVTAISADAGESKFACEPGETYIMNVMVSGHPYWVPVFQGYKQAGEAMGCKVIFSGTPDYDITKQIASFEQDLAKRPAGILLHPMNADPFIEPINRAIEGGTTVVTFAADSPKSNRVSYITSDNLAEAKYAADEIAGLMDHKGKFAVLENPGQSNHDLRITAFLSYMEKHYPNMKLVGRQATNQDATKAYTSVSSMLQAHPDLGALWIPEAGSAEGAVQAVLEAKAKVIIMHADISPVTREHIKAGNIHQALSPNQGMQGYMGFMLTFMAKHPDLIDPFNDYKRTGFNPMGVPFVDNGFAVVTKANADDFDLGAYMKNRSAN